MLRAVLSRPVSVVIATVTLVILGFFSLLRLPVSLLPTLERPRLVVTVRDADAARDDLVRQVAQPLERRLLSLPGVLEIRTTVTGGECTLRLATEWQTDVDRLRIDAERRLSEIASAGVDELLVRVETGDRTPILKIAVLGGESAAVRTTFADKVLIPELGRLPGAGRLRRLGGASLRPVVRPNAASLAAHGLTAADLAARLEHVGRTRPSGRLRDGGRVRPLTVREPVASVAELASRRVGGDSSAGRPGVALAELAEVAMEEVPDAGLFRLDGEGGVLVEVYRAPGTNAVLLARAARRVVAELAARNGRGQGPAGLRLVALRDTSREVVEALVGLAAAAFVGLLLGTLVLRWMLGTWRPTLALSVVVPASIVSAFGAFYVWDVSLDVVSLAGLALAAGMLIDNSIVVLEAIESARARRARSDGGVGGALRDEDAATPEEEGTRQIAMALVASFVTTAVVFLPLIYLQGLARAFFGVQAFAIVTSLAVSLALSLALTPILARRMRSGASSLGPRGRSPGLPLYLRALDHALAHPRRVIALTLVLLLAAAALVPILPRELLPAGPSRVLAVDYRLPPGLSRGEAERRVDSLDRILGEAGRDGNVRRSTLLRRSDPLRPEVFGERDDVGESELELAGAAALESAREGLSRRLARHPGLELELRTRRGAVAAAVEASSRRVEVEMSAATAPRVEALASRVTAALRAAGLGVDRQREEATGGSHPGLALSWDSWRLAQLGADAETLGGQVTAALGGFYAGRVDIEGAEPEILLEATRPADPSLLPVRPGPVAAGRQEGSRVVPLAALGSIRGRLEPAALERQDGRPSARLLLAGLSGSRQDMDRLETLLDEIPLAVDERLRLGGQARELQRSFSQLRLALGLALVLVFLAVAALYESLAMPLVVMTTVPVAAAGALGALGLTGQSLNVMSFLGLILLSGIVVNNAIVLVHRIEQHSAPGSSAGEAIRDAARERYRPILMTTLTTLLGMVPLAAIGGQGAEMRQALAITVSGGLVTSFYAALLVVPVLHRALVRRGAP